MNPSIAFSATNPCHVYDLAVALHERAALLRYYSGYPAWKLNPPPGFPLTTHSLRTVLTYGLLRAPHQLRPSAPTLFRWQDNGFDRAIAGALEYGNGAFLHGLPGQAMHTFKAARDRDWRTVLNHASGPVRQQLALIAPEYERAGLRLSDFHHFDAQYFTREDAEYAAADFHCVASSIVARQLQQSGISPEKIWVVPYAADPRRFYPPPTPEVQRRPRIVFAGQVNLRKGFRVLLAAARELRKSQPVELHVYGRRMPDADQETRSCHSEPWIHFHGPVSQELLAEAFRSSAALVLPSWEEAFGLVVPQALNCGLPCIVSDRVGAADLIRHRVNGSIFAAGDHEKLASEIHWWLLNSAAFSQPLLTWDQPAALLLAATHRQAA